MWRGVPKEILEQQRALEIQLQLNPPLLQHPGEDDRRLNGERETSRRCSLDRWSFSRKNNGSGGIRGDSSVTRSECLGIPQVNNNNNNNNNVNCKWMKKKSKADNKRPPERGLRPSIWESNLLGSCTTTTKSVNDRSQVSTLSDIPERVLSLDLPQRKDDYNNEEQEVDNERSNGRISDQEEDGFPDVNALLEASECYMNWLGPECTEGILLLIQHIDSKYITPADKFEREESMRWYNFQHIAGLGALCFLYVQLKRFPQARAYVLKARNFIAQSAGERDLLVPSEYLASFDYIWDHLCLYGSLKEWEYCGVMDLFPEMNLLLFPRSFHTLDPRVKAGVYCIKSYFMEFQKTRLDAQIDTLRQAISCWPHYHEWFICLQSALRCQRVKYHEYHHVYPWDAEIQATWTASQLAPNNPRCLLAGIQLLAEIAKNQIMETKWTIIRFGDINFHGVMEVKSFMKEQAEKVIKLAPKSVRINTCLAQLFTSVLPYGHRDFRVGKECLERALKAHPDSCKANHRMAEFYLAVDTNYRRAEMYYELALEANEKSFPSLVAKIQCIMRTADVRKKELMSLLEEQLKMPYWEAKEIGGLYFLKGLFHVGTEETREAVSAFITAYITHDRALNFQELPSLHRKFGWPGWPQSSKLSFANIRIDLLRERTRSDPSRKAMIDIVLKYLNGADAYDRRSQVAKQNWRR